MDFWKVISAEILHICRETSSVVQFIKTSSVSTSNFETKVRSFRC